MARTPASLANGTRITDYIGLGVVAKWIPRESVNAALRAAGKESRRHRDLPAHLVV